MKIGDPTIPTTPTPKSGVGVTVAAPARCSWQGKVRSLVAPGRAIDIRATFYEFWRFKCFLLYRRTCWTV